MTFPWQDRSGAFSWVKAPVFVALFLPAFWLFYSTAAHQFGPLPLEPLTYWSGVWATAFLLLALAVTPAAALLRWSKLVTLRRMIGVAGLLYTLLHMVIYFALRSWNFGTIGPEMVTRFTLIVASISTIGLLALAVTSWALSLP